MSFLNKCADDLRRVVLDFGRIAPAHGKAGSYFSLCQQLTGIADMLEGNFETESDAAQPKGKRDMRKTFAAGPVKDRSGNVVKVDFKARKRAV